MTINWMKHYLENRVQIVKVGNSFSNPENVLSGVPQGTVFGPLLFIPFTNEIPLVIKSSNISVYADDTKIYKEIKSIDDCIALDSDVKSVNEWALNWQLKINPLKSSLLHIPSKSFDYNYSIDDNFLLTSDVVRDLGLMVQSNLKFNVHCAKIANRAFAVSRNIHHCFRGHEFNFYVKLFKTYVRPIVESNIVAFSPITLESIDLLERVQKRFTKFLPGAQ